MKIETGVHPVLLSVAPWNSKLNFEKMTQIMFETFRVPAFNVSRPAVLALYAAGCTSGVVLDSGYEVTSASKIFEGWDGYTRYYQWLGGRQLTDYLAKLLRLTTS